MIRSKMSPFYYLPCTRKIWVLLHYKYVFIHVQETPSPRSDDRFTSTIGFATRLRCHLDIESATWPGWLIDIHWLDKQMICFCLISADFTNMIQGFRHWDSHVIQRNILENTKYKEMWLVHYNDVIMSAMASQITSFYDCFLHRLFGRRSKKTSSSASLAFVRGIHRSPMNSPNKGPVRPMFPLDDVIMLRLLAFNHQNQGVTSARSQTIYCGQIPMILCRVILLRWLRTQCPLQ